MLTKITLEVQVSSFSDTFSTNFPRRSVLSYLLCEPTHFWKALSIWSKVPAQNETNTKKRWPIWTPKSNQTSPILWLISWNCPHTSTMQQVLSADSATFSNVHMYFFCCYAFPKPFTTIWQCTSMFAWSGMRRFRPTDEYVVLHIFKYAVSAKG